MGWSAVKTELCLSGLCKNRCQVYCNFSPSCREFWIWCQRHALKFHNPPPPRANTWFRFISRISWSTVQMQWFFQSIFASCVFAAFDVYQVKACINYSSQYDWWVSSNQTITPAIHISYSSRIYGSQNFSGLSINIERITVIPNWISRFFMKSKCHLLTYLYCDSEYVLMYHTFILLFIYF